MPVGFEVARAAFEGAQKGYLMKRSEADMRHLARSGFRRSTSATSSGRPLPRLWYIRPGCSAAR
jgi:hypothetical protein